MAERRGGETGLRAAEDTGCRRDNNDGAQTVEPAPKSSSSSSSAPKRSRLLPAAEKADGCGLLDTNTAGSGAAAGSGVSHRVTEESASKSVRVSALVPCSCSRCKFEVKLAPRLVKRHLRQHGRWRSQPEETQSGGQGASAAHIAAGTAAAATAATAAGTAASALVEAADPDEARKQQERVAITDIIKDTHKGLRIKLLQHKQQSATSTAASAAGGDHSGDHSGDLSLVESMEVWQAHVDDREALQRYSSAMHVLGEQHWDASNADRLTWCRNRLKEYFWDGGCQAAVNKDRRRAVFRMVRRDSEGTTEGAKADAPEESVDLEARVAALHPIPPQRGAEDRIALLDIGSCYNPFRVFPELEVTAVDLVAATDDVLEADILTLSIGPPNSPVMTSGKKLESLPAASFDAVALCMVLSYIPCPKLRLRVMVQVRKLLKRNGLVLLICPDSRNENKTAIQMKQWKQIIEREGFRRWRYEKREHVTCMAFRAVAEIGGVVEDSPRDGGGGASALPYELSFPLDDAARREMAMA